MHRIISICNCSHYNTNGYSLQGKNHIIRQKNPLKFHAFAVRIDPIKTEKARHSKSCAGQRGRRLEIVKLLGSAGELLTVIGMSQVDEHLCALADGGTTEIGNAVLGNNILDVVTLMGHNCAGSQGSLDLGQTLLGAGLEAQKPPPEPEYCTGPMDSAQT